MRRTAWLVTVVVVVAAMVLAADGLGGGGGSQFFYQGVSGLGGAAESADVFGAAFS
jgi:hypothetical protein